MPVAACLLAWDPRLWAAVRCTQTTAWLTCNDLQCQRGTLEAADGWMRTLQNARNDTRTSGDWLSGKLHQRTTLDQLDPEHNLICTDAANLVLVWACPPTWS